MVLSAMDQSGYGDPAGRGAKYSGTIIGGYIMSIGYVAGIEKARKEVKPVVKAEVKEVKATKKATKKAVKEENFD